MKSLLESGVHFGHQTRRWDPKMSRYIFAERNGIHIIDLQKTLIEVKKAYEVIRKAVMDNKYVLFVGTKKQARTAIKREAERCNQYYVNNRWLGGMLTNFATIRQSIIKLKKIEKMEVDGTFDSLVKKEKIRLLKEKDKLEKNLGGIKNMDSLPGIIFVIDSKKEAIAVSEAKKLKIPIVAVVDTNCNPDEVDYPIPGNDDAIRAIDLFCSVISNACIDADNVASANIFEEGEGEEVKKVIEKLVKEDIVAENIDLIKEKEMEVESEVVADNEKIKDSIKTEDKVKVKTENKDKEELEEVVKEKKEDKIKASKDSGELKKKDREKKKKKIKDSKKVTAKKVGKKPKEEKAKNKVKLKDMKTGKEILCNLSDAVKKLIA